MFEADENKDCAFGSAHDPFEPVHYWQFVHAVCELASVVFDALRDDEFATNDGIMASALRLLLAEHLKANDVPTSYGEYWGGSKFGSIQSVLVLTGAKTRC